MGATEAHNYHLPYSADIIEAEEISNAAAELAFEKGAKLIVLPAIPFGVNTGQTDIKLNINVYPSTQYAILNNIIEVLDRQGVKKLIIVNSHGGNNFKTILRELGVKYPEMFLVTCDWFRALDKTEYFDENGDHADEMETSLLLYLKPELVLPLDEAGHGMEKISKVKGIKEGWAWSERKWSEVTEDTGIGNPKAATYEKGKKYFEDITGKLSDLFIEISEADKNDLYE